MIASTLPGDTYVDATMAAMPEKPFVTRTLRFHDPLWRLVLNEVRIYGTHQRVINAAVLLFSRADEAAKRAMIEEIADLEGRDPRSDESVAHADDRAAGRAADRQARSDKRRSKPA